VYDHDGDGYGLGCKPGPDCDDYDRSISSDCVGNCTYDVDCNGLPDEWQEQYFNSSVCADDNICGAFADPDTDAFSNIEEYRRGTSPLEKETVPVAPERPAESLDADGDGMPDACERMYGLDPTDPYDATEDNDGDDLSNRYECTFKEGMCVNWLNPTSPDTDNDGYADNEEINANTDPCDPDSKPSAVFAWILIILGALFNTGALAYIIYKKYYIPLVSPPPKPAAVPKAAPRRAAVRPTGVPRPGARPRLRPRRLAPRKPTGPTMSKEQFEKEMQKRAEERERVLKAFGTRKELPKKPSKVMEEIARKPEKVRRIGVKMPTPPPKAPPPKLDQVRKLSKIVGKDYFDRISGLTKAEADYFGKLATITKKKEVPLKHDQVAKLASITKKVVKADDIAKKKELEKAFKKSDIDKLDDFLTSKKRVDTFIKEEAPGTGKSTFDALDDMASPKRKEVIAALDDITSRKAKETAMTKMDDLAGAGSKKEIFSAFKKMSREKHVDKNVFEVLLSYLLKSGKITKHDVSEILFGLEGQGVLEKKDVAEVFFNLGIKK
jgi:hypothetical protein